MISIDPSELTLGDIADLEEHVGIPGSEIFVKLSAGDWSAKMFEGMAWVAGRRDNPEFTLEAARKLRMSEIEIVGPEEDDDPLEEPA